MGGKRFGTWPTAGKDGPGGSSTATMVGTATSDTAKVNTTVVPQHRVGSVYPDENGGLWMYINSTVALVEGHWAQIPSMSSTGLCAKAVTGNTTLGRMPLGVVGGDIAADDYGWVQIFGHNTHAGLVADTETTTALVGRVLFISGTAGLATSDTAVPDLIYGAFTAEASATSVIAGSQVGDTAMTKKIAVDLVYPYAIGGATTTQ
jgi:hypothetical protein